MIFILGIFTVLKKILTWLKFDSEPSAAITQGISAFEFNIKLERKKKYFEVKNRKQKKSQFKYLR